ncbi:MGC83745 protein, putative [Trichomonas vaginalis G3]|uniref:MGC83745 protein, putative n=1 Tax=Trichomonas vaginalis (strain ATCC PRA-98 / G3) TaxID=412133 RepID=A2DWU0_TRIV3|nr:spectrin binding [Trichomonas vaginalis G3]EAY15122.1 MGC83745 protein, putative [Trichomonas vaginalis G3]KAI5499186.1 spectrin binding [Trichomonas vaginalis G3]|eukprot:XP_001327345.1 MGC83745 protein [Trichomonas vaginalis G3]
MSQGLDINQIANDIQTYIDQGNFYDTVEKDSIPKVMDKTNLNSNDFTKLLSQGKTKYGASKLYKLSRKCDVSINSMEDVINVLQIYDNLFKLKSSHSIIDYLENQYISNYAKLAELPMDSDFDTVYKYLKGLSDQGDKLRMSIACAAKLSEVRDSDEFTPLLYACYDNNLQLVKSLIEGGCNKNAVTKSGSNCLLLASFDGYLEIVKYLIEAGFDKDWRKQSNKFNAILCASQKGHLETVKYLKSIGCDVNSKQKGNSNCIYCAATEGHLETIQYLVSAGCNPDEKDVSGITPLNVASRYGFYEVVKYLLECGCNKDAIDNGGMKPIDYAKEKQFESDNYRKIVDLLNQ